MPQARTVGCEIEATENNHVQISVLSVLLYNSMEVKQLAAKPAKSFTFLSH